MESFLSLSTAEAIWCAVVICAAACVRGFSGFGFTAILMAGLTTSLPISQIVPLSIALEVAASTGQAPGILHEVNWRKLSILLVTGLLGTPLGILLLGAVSDQILRILVLIFIFASSLALISSRRPGVQLSEKTYAGCGFAIGVTNGATALSGLMLALFFSVSKDQPAQIRATMIAYLFAADLWAGGLLVATGFYDQTTIARIIAALPLLAVGVWLGSRQFRSAKPDGYKRFVLWLILLLSSLSLVLFLFQSVLPA